MSSPAKPSRHPQRGIVLISTLLSLTLIVGITSLVQSQALATAKVLKRLEAVEVAGLVEASEREVLRPSMVVAVLKLSRGDSKEEFVFLRSKFGGVANCYVIRSIGRGKLSKIIPLEQCPAAVHPQLKK